VAVSGFEYRRLRVLFGVDKSTFSLKTRRILAALDQLKKTTCWLEPPGLGQGKNIEQALRAYPDFLALVDEVEQPRPASNGSPSQEKPIIPANRLTRPVPLSIPFNLSLGRHPFRSWFNLNWTQYSWLHICDALSARPFSTIRAIRRRLCTF
jgi:hypothetical protein